MSNRIGFEDPRLQSMEQATLWLQRMRTAGQDDRVVEGWLDWCQRDPLNQQAFDEIAAIWEISAQLPRAAAQPVAPRSRVSRRALVAAVVGLGLSGIGGAWWWNHSRDTVQTSAFSTPVGVNRVEKLADGSALALGGGTRVTVTLGRRERRVELLEGEVFVTVHHDTSRPFWVASGTFEVVATGTAFNVMRTEGRTTVTVAEGSVAAFHEGRAEEANVVLKAGQQLVYRHDAHSVDVRTTDPAQVVAWRTGMLHFEGEPLSEVVARINRYAGRPIVIDDARIRAFIFNGSALTRADGIDRWLKTLPDAPFDFPIRVTQLPDGRRLVAPRPGAAD